jgi:hypothetical protein
MRITGLTTSLSFMRNDDVRISLQAYGELLSLDQPGSSETSEPTKALHPEILRELKDTFSQREYSEYWTSVEKLLEGKAQDNNADTPNSIWLKAVPHVKDFLASQYQRDGSLPCEDKDVMWTLLYNSLSAR